MDLIDVDSDSEDEEEDEEFSPNEYDEKNSIILSDSSSTSDGSNDNDSNNSLYNSSSLPEDQANNKATTVHVPQSTVVVIEEESNNDDEEINVDLTDEELHRQLQTTTAASTRIQDFAKSQNISSPTSEDETPPSSPLDGDKALKAIESFPRSSSKRSARKSPRYTGKNDDSDTSPDSKDRKAKDRLKLKLIEPLNKPGTSSSKKSSQKSATFEEKQKKLAQQMDNQTLPSNLLQNFAVNSTSSCPSFSSTSSGCNSVSIGSVVTGTAGYGRQIGANPHLASTSKGASIGTTTAKQQSEEATTKSPANNENQNQNQAQNQEPKPSTTTAAAHPSHSSDNSSSSDDEKKSKDLDKSIKNSENSEEEEDPEVLEDRKERRLKKLREERWEKMMSSHENAIPELSSNNNLKVMRPLKKMKKLKTQLNMDTSIWVGGLVTFMTMVVDQSFPVVYGL